jgi:phosphatidylglycerophosphate synthase
MVANILTALRLVVAAAFCVVAACLAAPTPTLAVAAALIAIGVAEELTDLFDGMAARHFGTASQIGGIVDPMVDSLSRLAIYFALALLGWVSIAVPLVMTGRDVIVAYTRIVNALTGGKTSARTSGKLKAIIQGGGIAVLVAIAWLGHHLPAGTIGTLRIVGAGIIVAATAWSLIDYLRGAMPGLRTMARSAAK